MSGITPEQRGKWQRDAARDKRDRFPCPHSRRILTLLGALDKSEAENARLRALLAEDVALLEELDAAWGGAGGAGS